MQEDPKDFCLRKERMHFSKYFKRKVLIEYASIKKPRETFLACGFYLNDAQTKDLKYASKLIHKWKKELIDNNNLLCFMNVEMTDEALESELMSLGPMSNPDYIMDVMEDRIRKYFCGKRRRKAGKKEEEKENNKK